MRSLRIALASASFAVLAVPLPARPVSGLQGRTAMEQGIALEAAGKLDEALQQYSRAIVKNASLGEAWRRRGWIP